MKKQNDGLQVVKEMVMFDCTYSHCDDIRVVKDSNNEVTVAIRVDIGETMSTPSVNLTAVEQALFTETLVKFLDALEREDKPAQKESAVVICPESNNTRFTVSLHRKDCEISFDMYGDTVFLDVFQVQDIVDLLKKDLKHVHISERVIGGDK
ncbi:gp180 [Bacillus phage W.Ph.]|uniref:Gp180 n=1 Tax=Bacillus phage W.Ph. TaxID=764595 RepID=G9B1T1_9CAUD|nr:gp180 [Bacillus phage W.Ph.]ADH03326.1 gp180 [Bacillus phage W.Ph.]